MKLIAVLGSHPNLSSSELSSVLQTSPEAKSLTVALFNTPEAEFSRLQSTLGGTQKLAEVLEEDCDLQTAMNRMQQTLQAVPGEDKLRFGISVYDLGDEQTAKKLTKERERIGLTLKKTLKSSGRSVRYVTAKEEVLSTVVVAKNKLTTKGAEFLLVPTPGGITLAQTRTVQDFEDWSHRDYDRPARDARRGMLPPKLARMMINLCGVDPKGATLFDPFCGSGTVLMEGAMLGFSKLIGSDISKDATRDTKANLEWLANERVAIPELDIHTSAAADVLDFVPAERIDAIVAEPFLGKPRQGDETREQVASSVQELETLYRESFGALAKTLKPEGVAVIAIPVHFVDGHATELPIAEILDSVGLVEDPISNEPVLYKREDQHVGRRITRCRRT